MILNTAEVFVMWGRSLVKFLILQGEHMGGDGFGMGIYDDEHYVEG